MISSMGAALRHKQFLAELKHVLTLLENAGYDAAAMELADLKNRIKRRIVWIDEEMQRLNAKREALSEKLDALQGLDDIETEFEANEAAEIEGLDFRPYAGMTQEAATLELLKGSANPLHPTEIAVLLKEGGYPFKTDDPVNAVYVMLNRLRADGKISSIRVEKKTRFVLAENGKPKKSMK